MSVPANPITLYQTADGHIRLEVRLDAATVWLTQAQMVELFGRDQSVVSRHIRNAFADGEESEKSNMQKLHIANADRPVAFYDLDVIISAGYRIKSPQGVRFRRWATRVLRKHLLQGYTLNQARLKQNAAELEQALTLIQKAARSPAILVRFAPNRLRSDRSGVSLKPFFHKFPVMFSCFRNSAAKTLQ